MTLINSSKRASIFITGDELRDILKLPEGMSILAIQGNFDPAGIKLIVSSYDLAIVEPGTESPILAGGTWRRTMEYYRPRLTNEPMKRVITWEWEPQKPEPKPLLFNHLLTGKDPLP